MPAELDPRIVNWSGGRIRIFLRTQRKVALKNAVGAQWTMKPGPLKFDQEAEAKPFGPGLALVEPFSLSLQRAPGVWIDIGVRAGQLQVVAIRSEEDGPELTQPLLKSLGSLRKIIQEHTGAGGVVRLAVDEHGEIYGVVAYTEQDGMVDTDAAVAGATGKPGRPQLTRVVLEEVARVVRKARAERTPTDKAVARHFHISFGAAKKRIRIARARGAL